MAPQQGTVRLIERIDIAILGAEEQLAVEGRQATGETSAALLFILRLIRQIDAPLPIPGLLIEGGDIAIARRGKDPVIGHHRRKLGVELTHAITNGMTPNHLRLKARFHLGNRRHGDHIDFGRAAIQGDSRRQHHTQLLQPVMHSVSLL